MSSDAQFDREKAIEVLIEDDMNVIIDCGHDTYLADILHNGFIGYRNLTDNQLVDECEERGISYLVGDDD